jgi:hypothetical protein
VTAHDSNQAIVYADDARIEPEQLADLYNDCSLGARRPVDDLEIASAMLRHANLTISAWQGDRLVGIARTLTDFLYVGYLADLAVRDSCQKGGIGEELIRRTRLRLGPRSMIVLFAAPDAKHYYQHIGFQSNTQGWILRADDPFPVQRR